MWRADEKGSEGVGLGLERGWIAGFGAVSTAHDALTLSVESHPTSRTLGRSDSRGDGPSAAPTYVALR